MSRTFTEAEAQKIFARVAERQRATGTSAAAGLSLSDLEEAAQAAGLDPALIASAAAEIDAPQARRGRLGAPTDVSAQRVVRGGIGDEAWEAMVAEARREFRRPGIAGQIGRTREWTVVGSSNNAQPTTRLALEPVGDDTRIVLSQSVRDAALGLTIAGGISALMSVLFGILTLLQVDPEIGVAAAIVTVMAILLLGGSQIGLRLWQRRQGRRFETLLDRLELSARGTGSTRVPSAGRVDPALFDTDAPVEEGDADRTRTRA